MSKFIIFVISGIVLLLVLGMIVFILTHRKNRVQNQQDQLKENERMIENQRTIWMRSTKRSVEVDTFAFFEVFDTFPYLSTFENTRAFLLKNKVSFKAINSFINDMLDLQTIIFNEFRVQQKRLLNEFDHTYLQDNQANRKFLMRYYIKNLDNFQMIMTDGFVKTLLKPKIAALLNGNNFNQNIVMQKLLAQLMSNTQKLIDNLMTEAKSQFAKEHPQPKAQSYQKYYYQEQTRYQQEQNSVWRNDFDDETWAYKALGLNKTASFEEVKKQYKKLAMQYHPDRNHSEAAKTKMVEINQAYDYIKKIQDK